MSSARSKNAVKEGQIVDFDEACYRPRQGLGPLFFFLACAAIHGQYRSVGSKMNPRPWQRFA